LPARLSPGFCIAVADFTADGKLDLALVITDHAALPVFGGSWPATDRMNLGALATSLISIHLFDSELSELGSLAAQSASE